MTISSALEKFESLSVCPDVIKVSTKNGTLADLFEAHKTDFLASGKRTYHHFETLRSVIRESGLLSESTIAKKITTNDVRAILNNVYQRTQKRAWVNQIRTYMHTLFSWGVKSDKSPLLDKPDIRFDILFNPVTPIPVLEAPAYVGERFLSFDELALLLKTTNDCYFNADVAVLIQLVFFCGGQRPYEIMGSEKRHYDKQNRLLSIPPAISKTKKWYYLQLCDSAIELIDMMLERYPDSEYIFPNADYEIKISRWNEKVKSGTVGKHTKMPRPFMSSDLLCDNINRFCKQKNIQSFIPRDFRRTFKTLGGQLKITKDIRDRIQNHALNDVSSVHYDRYDYAEEKMEGLLVWESKIKSLMYEI
ncbi:Phage integrase family protein [compost metagenome]